MAEPLREDVMKNDRFLRICILLSFVLLALPASLNAVLSADHPEAMAVEDITYLGCEITEITYEWNGPDNFDKPIESKTLPCPPGSVTRSFPISVAEAESIGYRYVVLTGDRAIDDAALTALERSFLPFADSAMTVDIASVEGGQPAFVKLQSCRAYSKSKSISYWAGGTGAGVRATAYYYQSQNCNWYLSRATDYIFDPLSPGQDIYWDEIYLLGTIWSSWDAGCVRMYNYGTYTTYISGYQFPINRWFTDETINDSSLGCSFWGEEYNGSVYLTP